MKKKQIPQVKTKEDLTPKKEEKEKKEKGKPGRPTIFTPELKAKLIKLFEEYFFIAIVAAKADIYRARIGEWEREGEDFRNDVMHARDKWIAQQMKLLDQYAKDKREKDWRALKYKLSIADIEYNDKKYLRDDSGKRDTPLINIIINQKDLATSKKEAYKIIGGTKLREETVSLLPFREEEREKKQEKRQTPKNEKPET